MARVAVIGAGFVGLSSAYWLMRDGHAVTLFDPQGPAGGASYGNAGTFANYACIPVNNPSVFRDFHRYLFSSKSPFRLRLSYLPQVLPWLARFLLHSTRTRYEHSAGSLAAMLARAYGGYADLITDAGLASFLRQRECLYLYSSESAFRGSEASLDLRRRLGVSCDVLNASEIQRLEPGLAPIFPRGVVFPNSWHLTDPAGFLTVLHGWLQDRGMQDERQAVLRISAGINGAGVTTENGPAGFDHVVVAAGAHSRALAADCGDRLPLDTERGYHVTFAGAEQRISRPVGWAERGFYMTPMAQGLRVAGTVELAGLTTTMHAGLTDLLTFSARQALPSLPTPVDSWLGFRPSFPDGLPVLGYATASKRVVYAFGHQHVGLTLGGLSGAVVADLVAGRTPAIEMSAVDPRRF